MSDILCKHQINIKKQHEKEDTAFLKTFFSRKPDFSRKLEGGTGLQGVSSNLNLFSPFLLSQRPEPVPKRECHPKTELLEIREHIFLKPFWQRGISINHKH